MGSVGRPRFALGRFSVDGEASFVGVVLDDAVVPPQDTPAATASLFDDWAATVAELLAWIRCTERPYLAGLPRPDIPGIGTDWLASKNAPTSSPTGPFLVPAELVDPERLRIVLRLNGTVMQDGRTSEIIFGIPRLIEHVPAITELMLEGQITGLGSQRNRCVS